MMPAMCVPCPYASAVDGSPETLLTLAITFPASAGCARDARVDDRDGNARASDAGNRAEAEKQTGLPGANLIGGGRGGRHVHERRNRNVARKHIALGSKRRYLRAVREQHRRVAKPSRDANAMTRCQRLDLHRDPRTMTRARAVVRRASNESRSLDNFAAMALAVDTERRPEDERDDRSRISKSVRRESWFMSMNGPRTVTRPSEQVRSHSSGKFQSRMIVTSFIYRLLTAIECPQDDLITEMQACAFPAQSIT